MEFSPGKVFVSASNPDLGEAVEEVDADYHGSSLAVGFNARYLLDVLGVLGAGGVVELELKDELSPGLIRGSGHEGYLYVLMPMRL
jgi:DNA polymerase-3 subunit beta